MRQNRAHFTQKSVKPHFCQRCTCKSLSDVIFMFCQVENGGAETKKLGRYLMFNSKIKNLQFGIIATGYPATIFVNAYNSEMHHGRLLILVYTPSILDT